MSAAFHKLKVAEVRRETDDSVSVRFEVPETLKKDFAFVAGQHLTLRADIKGEDVRRNYSLCRSPLDGEWRVAVKATPGGAFSPWINTALKAGDVLDVMAPHGSFTHVFNAEAAHNYVGVAGGSGVTPILSLLRTALMSEPKSRFTLLYGNRNAASIMFLEELAALKDQFMDRLRVFHFLEEEEEEIALFNGRLDGAKMEEVFSGLVDPSAVDAFFICGPGPMMEAVERALIARAVPKERILIERFTIGPQSAAQTAAARAIVEEAAGRKLSIVLDGRRRTIVFDAEKGNILDSARGAGMPAPFACKGGVCATCRAKVLQGSAAMKVNYGLTEEEVAQGYILTCQAAPTSDDLVVSYDA